MALIYIIEDDDSIREIEEFALINAGHKVLGFACAKDFYRRLDDVIPDLCLVDIMLPDESGNEIVRKLRKNPDTKNIPVIMVTAKTTEMDLVRGLEDGADDYIKKPFSVMELMSRVKALLRRVQPREVEELVLDELVMNNVKHEVTVEGRVVELTFKEYELLSLFLVNKGIVLSRDTIMDKVWGTDYEGESRTIDMHVKTLRQKLGNYGNRIRTIRNVGYVIE
ncbi:MAG: response regulator transcription factor [Bacillota bacterium]|nr:response regulator transcription factor [Clostridiales bacterium]MDD6979611.1 response regulator transcription factor [Bacillota bacterium]MDO4471933.1 response regulator transcription factor [Bacillota bacterium]MDY6173461.1 response regulator transcription factor [Lentihominibacter sp.]